MRLPKNSTFGSLLASIRSRPFGWTDLLVFPVVLALSIPPLVWFGHQWLVTQDAGRYLLSSWHLVSGLGYTVLGEVPETKRGPVFPGLLGFLMVFFGHDPESLAWGVRLLALVNPVLAYFLVIRLSGPVAGLLAAALVTLLSYTAVNPEAFNIDGVQLTIYLLSLLALLAALHKNTPFLALLSGLLLGATIVTKETAFVNLPLALLATLLLGWNLRGALWHYLGVTLVCLPWWIWVWLVSKQVYLVGRFPTGLQVPIVIGALVFVGLAVGAYYSGVVDRFLADERRRRWTGWLLTLTWAILLSGFLLTTSPALANLSFDALRSYAIERLAPHIAVWPLLLVAGAYVVWKALRGNPLWRLFAIALLFQFPICLLVTVEGWHPRQFLVPQTLMLCALAVLVTETCEPLVRTVRDRRYPGWSRLVIAVPLVIYLIAAAGVQTRVLLFEHSTGQSGGGRGAEKALEMANWMAENVPRDGNIAITVTWRNYMVFLDGDRHRWVRLQLDQLHIANPTKPKKERASEKHSVFSTPPNTVWLNLGERMPCSATYLSVPNIVSQTERQDIRFLLMTGYPTYPGLLRSSSSVADSGAFEIVHRERAVGDEGFVLLQSTGRPPRAVPAWMDASTVIELKRCVQTEGPGYAERIRSRFPNGITLVPNSNRTTKRDTEARQVIKEVYQRSGTARSGSLGSVSGSRVG